MAAEKKGAQQGQYSAIVTSSPKPLKSSDEMRRPNAYLNDWTHVATKDTKTKTK